MSINSATRAILHAVNRVRRNRPALSPGGHRAETITRVLRRLYASHSSINVSAKGSSVLCGKDGEWKICCLCKNVQAPPRCPSRPQFHTHDLLVVSVFGVAEMCFYSSIGETINGRLDSSDSNDPFYQTRPESSLNSKRFCLFFYFSRLSRRALIPSEYRSCSCSIGRFSVGFFFFSIVLTSRSMVGGIRCDTRTRARARTLCGSLRTCVMC